jgi:hypothetical protein
MPLGDRIRRRRRRLVRDGDEYTVDEENRDEIELELPERREEPPVDVQGEPWGWTKDGPRPKGWPGPDNILDNPGPFDGSWEEQR